MTPQQEDIETLATACTEAREEAARHQRGSTARRRAERKARAFGALAEDTREGCRTWFEFLASKCPLRCDICGGQMHAMYGGGYDYDRIKCADRWCGAEITFPTTTEVPE